MQKSILLVSKPPVVPFLREQQFVSPGTYEFVVPRGVKEIKALVIGGGASYSGVTGGKGGGVISGVIPVKGRDSFTVTVGAVTTTGGASALVRAGTTILQGLGGTTAKRGGTAYNALVALLSNYNAVDLPTAQGKGAVNFLQMADNEWAFYAAYYQDDPNPPRVSSPGTGEIGAGGTTTSKNGTEGGRGGGFGGGGGGGTGSGEPYGSDTTAGYSGSGLNGGKGGEGRGSGFTEGSFGYGGTATGGGTGGEGGETSGVATGGGGGGGGGTGYGAYGGKGGEYPGKGGDGGDGGEFGGNGGGGGGGGKGNQTYGGKGGNGGYGGDGGDGGKGGYRYSSSPGWDGNGGNGGPGAIVILY